MRRRNVASACTEKPIHTSYKVRVSGRMLVRAERRTLHYGVSEHTQEKPEQAEPSGKRVRLMTRTSTNDRPSPIYALVTASEPIGQSRTVHVALIRDGETLWSLTETFQAANPHEPVLLALWRLFGEASRRRLNRFSVYLDQMEVVEMLERRTPAPSELGKAFLLARSRLNQFGRVRFAPFREAPARAARVGAAAENAQLSLFDSAVA
jgi:hypothetical protein